MEGVGKKDTLNSTILGRTRLFDAGNKKKANAMGEVKQAGGTTGKQSQLIAKKKLGGV